MDGAFKEITITRAAVDSMPLYDLILSRQKIPICINSFILFIYIIIIINMIWKWRNVKRLCLFLSVSQSNPHKILEHITLHGPIHKMTMSLSAF